jgi:tRNA 2-thiocytidine biosynthesis protein TtcA
MEGFKRLLGLGRKAIQDYNMIEDGDKILVGVSGGKDSITLLHILASLRNFHEKKFSVEAITLTLVKDQDNLAPVKEICKKLNIIHHTLETQISTIVFDIRKEKNPCSMCANLRRGALYGFAHENNFQRVALGHNKDDVNETLIMSLFYEGRLNTFAPVTYLDRRKIYNIRPLIYASEKIIKEFVKKNNIPIVNSCCPANGKTTRQDIKELIYKLEKEKYDLSSNIFGAIKRSRLDGWGKLP